MNQQREKCAVIIVTHNSASYLEKCMQALLEQTIAPSQIIIVDSGSNDTEYITRYGQHPNTEIVLSKENVGFCHGNNLGWEKVTDSTKYVLLLNPDAFLTPTFIDDAVKAMEKPENCRYGALTGKLLAYDIKENAQTGTYDSTGVFQRWWGKWYDRGQGKKVVEQRYNRPENVPAICGALYFSRKAAVDSVLLYGGQVFDETFHMYKEDIDLSLRLRRSGWWLLYEPKLIAYHCRGWCKQRAAMPRALRLRSARNEVAVQRRQRHPIGMLYATAKWLAVRYADL